MKRRKFLGEHEIFMIALTKNKKSLKKKSCRLISDQKISN